MEYSFSNSFNGLPICSVTTKPLYFKIFTINLQAQRK